MADCTPIYIDYKTTQFFNNLVLDYLDRKEHLAPFYAHYPDLDGIKASIQAKQQHKIDRNTLVTVLKEQYKAYHTSPKVAENIEALLSENTFTICTAHQPNLMTGYAYFIYKIMHAIKLADTLKDAFPTFNFVPVYYIGSEDDDLDELGIFRFNDKVYRWDTNQKGAVGRMSTADLDPLIAEFSTDFPQNSAKAIQLKAILTYAYTHYKTISEATRYIVNELMGEFGILVIDPDHHEFKKAFQPVIREEFKAPKAYEIVNDTNNQLGNHYKHQAFVRPINFFFLKDNIRERIEREGDTWKVINTAITFDQKTLEETIENHPEYFSPNVILRGLFQETILPNIVFIGGGSEVAYWMQLKGIFDHYQVPFPVLMLRQSIQFQSADSSALQEALGLCMEELFIKEESLITQKVKAATAHDTHTYDFVAAFEQTLAQIKNRGLAIDHNLEYSTNAVLTKIKHQLEILEHKFYKAEKKNQQILVDQLIKLKRITFPKRGLTERYETFIPEYLAFDGDYFKYLYNNIKPLSQQFLWIK